MARACTQEGDVDGARCTLVLPASPAMMVPALRGVEALEAGRVLEQIRPWPGSGEYHWPGGVRALARLAELTRGWVSVRATEGAGDAPGATRTRSTYARVAQLPVVIERCVLVPMVRDTSSGFTKVSLVVRLMGNGHEGQGEDITWDQIDQLEFLRDAGRVSWLRGRRTFDEVSNLLGLAELFPVEPIRDSARFYRRWAFESAALDLALRQNGLSLQDAVARAARPVNFVASVRIGDPPSLGPLTARRRIDPALHFKLDPTRSWDDDLVRELARLGCVDVVDMKGSYSNATVAMEPEADLYRRVIEGLPGAWIEDPAIVGETMGLLERHRDRITWDEPIHCVADIEALPWPPRMLNIKPARFGSVRSLFDTYDYCTSHGIGAYGGGMFEQGPGRGQLQYLASLFHPAGPNDLAPAGYNLQVPARDLPRSPLAPEPHETGFRWGTYDTRRTIREPRPEPTGNERGAQA